MGPPLTLLIKKWFSQLPSQNQARMQQAIFNEIWKQYHQRLLFFIRPMVGIEAEDLLQEIMLKVYEHLGTYNPFYSFNTWIYTIARNHCLNFLEKKKLVTTTLAPESLPNETILSPDTPEAAVLHQELFQKIDGYLETLAPLHRQMAWLRFYEGRSIKTIAKILSVPTGTVKSRLFLIKKELQMRVEE
ncbi:sigma-70 family RNA polymerase sigma factor [candidate division KSB1 bacterium]|nr:sigma-70 family RNA polymerase sigma factor [candidate division KSB1 bacterium]